MYASPHLVLGALCETIPPEYNINDQPNHPHRHPYPHGQHRPGHVEIDLKIYIRSPQLTKESRRRTLIVEARPTSLTVHIAGITFLGHQARKKSLIARR